VLTVGRFSRPRRRHGKVGRARVGPFRMNRVRYRSRWLALAVLMFACVTAAVTDLVESSATVRRQMVAVIITDEGDWRGT
jgi:hypothetical protein